MKINTTKTTVLTLELSDEEYLALLAVVDKATDCDADDVFSVEREAWSAPEGIDKILRPLYNHLADESEQ